MFRESQLKFANDLFKIGMVRFNLERNTLDPLEKQKQFLQEQEFGREEADFPPTNTRFHNKYAGASCKGIQGALKRQQSSGRSANGCVEVDHDQIGMTIKDGIVESITAAVEGTRTVGEVAANTLRNIANMLLNLGVNMALFGVPTGVGKKDSGGLLSGISDALTAELSQQTGLTWLASAALSCLSLERKATSFQTTPWAAPASSSTSMLLERKYRATKATLISLAA